jgi:senataxin
MAELVQNIQDLASLDENIHWFCPRYGPEDGGVYYDEDVQGTPAGEVKEEGSRQAKVEEAQARTTRVLDCCTILAFDGTEAEPYQNQFKESLCHQLTRCDICVRVFHRSRGQLKTSLESQYDTDEVSQFMLRFDDMNIQRISTGLDSATEMLLDLPLEQRNITAAGNVGMYALFEALNCLPFLNNEDALRQHFDKPFQLVQSRKKIKLPGYAPGMAFFLFSTHSDRSTWALKNFATVKRPLSGVEFEFGVKPSLEQALPRVNAAFLDQKFLPLFWRGMRVILQKLPKDVVTNHLRALNVNLYVTALDHFVIDGPHFDDLIASFKILIEVSSSDFWDAFGACTPQQIIEQFFKSPVLEKKLNITTEREPLKLEEETLSWLPTFLKSIKPENLVPPVRAVVDQLLKRCQADGYSSYSRNITWRQGLRCLVEALQSLRRGVRGGPVLTHMAELVAKDYIGTVMSELDKIEEKDEMRIDATVGLCLLIVKEVLAIDVQSLTYDHALILQTRGLDHELGISSLDSWKMSMRAVKPGHAALPIALFQGIQGLLPLEPFAPRQLQAVPKQAQDWNTARDRVVDIAADDFLERLQAFTPDQLLEIYREQEGANGVLAMLFSGDDRLQNPTMNMLKTLSGEDTRRDSLMHVLKLAPSTTLQAVIAAVRSVAKAKAFTPCVRALKICSDLYSCLCDSSDGILRSSRTLDDRSVRSLETFWQLTWMTLNIIFEQTEPWSNLAYDKKIMQEFCRETMDFAELAFDQYSIIANTLRVAVGDATSSSAVGKKLLEFPKTTFTNVTKWLRLRDDYLIDKAVNLTTKMLLRLEEVGIEIVEEAAQSLDNVINNKTRTKLSMNQKAQISRAFDKHLGTSMTPEVIDVDAPPQPLKQSSLQKWALGRDTHDSPDSSRSVTPIEVTKSKKPGTLDLDAWGKSAAKSKLSSATLSALEVRQSNSSVTTAADAFRKHQEVRGKKPLGSSVRTAAPTRESQGDFLAKRRQAKEEADKAKAAALAKAKGVGAGSGVAGLGDMGKDHSQKGAGVMVSSDEESESDDDFDDELFGGKSKEKKQFSRGLPIIDTAGAVGLRPEMKKGPTRIQRTQRSMKDMRARLAPDLTSLHRVMLKWEYFHEGDYPPGANEHQFRAVANSFTDPTTYQETFQPLLTLEAWQGMIRSREEDSSAPYEIKVVSRSNVDQFIEISSSVTHVENRELKLQEGDIILLSTSKKPTEDSKAPHCLARVYKVKRQKAMNEIVYQLTGGSLGSSLTPGVVVNGVKVQSITPLEREYGALQGLQYYDLCNQIVKAKPSPRINYSEKQIANLQDIYNVNRAQSEAINAAMDNEGFSLIQGPPGSGKTKTIVAIVGGLLSNTIGAATTATRIAVPGQRTGDIGGASKKLLVCAPSNAAVDELVMRLKNGVKTKTGKTYPINVVRIGRSDAINSSVKDVTMDELVNKQIGGSNQDQGKRDETSKLYQDHKKVSAELKDLYDKRDSGDLKEGERKQVEEAIVGVRRRKNDLGTRIDNSKDQERQAGRESELNRKKAQQAVLDKAHVICATLSGSGHDMFQSLNIEFETVIIDEAAQCVEMSSLIPLKYGCVKCIMVGDPKQLPPTVFSKEAARFQYEQSLFVRMQNNFANEVHLLDTQYRMHPDISVFPSRTFYDGLLKDGDGMAGLRVQPWHKSALLAPYRFFDVKGRHSAAPKGHSLINLAEIDIAMAIYVRLRTDFPDYNFSGQIGIITPYKSQLRALKDRFATRFGNEIEDTIEFNTTDAYQGRESEIIIFSCVRASPAGGVGFLQDIRRMNVGLTRAKSSLWVLGNSDSLMRGRYWKMLVEDAQARDSYTTGSVMEMLQKPSSAFPANNLNTKSMMDVDAHQPQMQVGKNSRTPMEAPSRQSSVSNGALKAPERAKEVTSAQPIVKPLDVESSKMEGVTYRFQDRVANTKKRPASETGSEAARPRLGSEDVDMADAEPAKPTKIPGGLDGTVEAPVPRAETPLPDKEKVKTRVDGDGKMKTAPVAPVVPPPAPVRRKKKAAVDPFLQRKR